MKKNERAVVDVPEVQHYLDAVDVLEKFKEQNKDIFNVYEEIREEVRVARESADKTVRAQGISCGPWDRYSVRVSYNAETLYESLGRDGFMAVGGKIVTRTEYEVDSRKLESAIGRGEVPENVVNAVKKETASYHTPKDK